MTRGSAEGGTAGAVVGFVGLGNMGLPMAGRLVTAGYHVRGYDVSARARRFDEAHVLIVKARTAPEMFSWYGANYEYRYVNIWPRPVH